MGVPVSVLLAGKGSIVHSLSQDATLREVANRLAEYNVGSIIILRDDGGIAGLVSERDIVRAVAKHGGSILDQQVSDLPTPEVATCRPSTRTHELMGLMTQQRMRHVPVVTDDGVLVGIVSIGDVVKWQLDELSTEASQLEAYVTGSTYRT